MSNEEITKGKGLATLEGRPEELIKAIDKVRKITPTAAVVEWSIVFDNDEGVMREIDAYDKDGNRCWRDEWQLENILYELSEAFGDPYGMFKLDLANCVAAQVGEAWVTEPEYGESPWRRENYLTLGDTPWFLEDE